MELFQPNLTLSTDGNGTFTLHAVTLCPNSSYSAGPAGVGAPPSIRVMDTVEPVLLPLIVREGPSLPVLTPVRHRLTGLQLGPGSHKQSLVAWAMQGMHILGSSTIPITGGTTPKDGVPIDTSNWFAWLGEKPEPSVLHVGGTVTLPTPGYAVSLVLASPQGTNPRELILDLRVEAKPGIWPMHVTQMHVAYDERPATVPYQGVLVRVPGGHDVRFPVVRAG